MGRDDFNQKAAAFLADGMAHAGTWRCSRNAWPQAFEPIYNRVVIGDLRAEEGIIIAL